MKPSSARSARRMLHAAARCRRRRQANTLNAGAHTVRIPHILHTGSRAAMSIPIRIEINFGAGKPGRVTPERLVRDLAAAVALLSLRPVRTLLLAVAGCPPAWRGVRVQRVSGRVRHTL